MDNVVAPKMTCRALAAADLDRVVALDAALEGHSRREYFARRLHAALRQPKQHVQLAAADSRGLAGFLLARVLHGEFGRAAPALRLEAIGVRADAQGSGVGRMLFEGLLAWARKHEIAEVRTMAAWNWHSMLRWLDSVGFQLAPACVVDRAVAPGAAGPAVDDDDGGARGEVDYGAQSPNDFQKIERDLADVRSMRSADLADIVRIDRRHTGRERAAYVSGKLEETMADSAISVSLTARLDGTIAGFLTARVDLGDFGRMEPIAVIDTIGVDPGFAHRGAGRALLAQLMLNLSALHVERVETVVAAHDLALLRYFYAAGFAPSSKLVFVYRVREEADA
ncbi:MAG: GNAT family N-acetyltransferase [Burkholderiales bacterium]|nr:GNAT family N-acetyltransferase [Burkholderiales bacterium]